MTGKLRRSFLPCRGRALCPLGAVPTAGHGGNAMARRHCDGCVYGDLERHPATPRLHHGRQRAACTSRLGRFYCTGWNIRRNGAAYQLRYLCTTWGTDHRIKATSIYSY
ncbi:putative protein OS=Streptomyces antimycoticus OX=68175 GN=SSPO_093220 PE=4 SV=1 [Streptomyces antimycoticus]